MAGTDVAPDDAAHRSAGTAIRLGERADGSPGRIASLSRFAARWTRVLAPFAGPVLIVGAVLVVLQHFAFDGLISRQYPDVLPFWTPTYCFLGKSLAAGRTLGRGELRRDPHGQ